MKIKPSLSKGTRDFLPQEVAKRNYIFETIKGVFRKYGFEQIETPAIERLETLTGKYGEEGDKLLFKILNSGDYLQSLPEELLTTRNSQSATKHLSEKGLRYDLTVPLARYVVQHQDKLAFPFRRFHIGPVWRADRPQKGRYQEFYQCDADIIGSNSFLCEIELTSIYQEAFKKLNLPVIVKINERGVLNALAITLLRKSNGGDKNLPEVSRDLLNAIDKVDKIGIDEAQQELLSKGYQVAAVNHVWDIIKKVNSESDSPKRIKTLKESREAIDLDTQEDWLFWDSSISKLEAIIDNVKSDTLLFDLTLARGLDYYTGVIWEVIPNASIRIGSIGGGGRYANLTEMFGGQNMSGVGISFGIERIYDVMEELNLFPETVSQAVKILFVPREPALEEFTFQQVQTLRNAGIAAEIFLGNVKKQKQFTYAEAKHIPLLAEVGSDEMATGIFRVRETATRQEQKLTLQQIISRLQ